MSCQVRIQPSAGRRVIACHAFIDLLAIRLPINARHVYATTFYRRSRFLKYPVLSICAFALGTIQCIRLGYEQLFSVCNSDCTLKPRPRQQQCRSNIVECYKSNDSFDKFECCFHKVERCSTLLPLLPALR